MRIPPDPRGAADGNPSPAVIRTPAATARTAMTTTTITAGAKTVAPAVNSVGGRPTWPVSGRISGGI